MKTQHIGCINYKSDMAISTGKYGPGSYRFEDTSLLLPPENCIFSDEGDTELKSAEANLEHFHAEMKYIFNNNMFGTLTKGGKEIKENLEKAKENIEETKQRFPITKVRFQGEDTYLPLSYKVMAEFVRLARSGQNVDIELNVKEGKVSYTLTPVSAARKLQKRCITLK